MKITRRKLHQLINEIATGDSDEIERSKEAIAGSPPSVKYDTWLLELMKILVIEKPDNIPDITTYDAHQNNMTPQRYADLIGEPQEMIASPVSGDSNEDWIYDLEGEMEAKMQGIESGNVVDLDDMR